MTVQPASAFNRFFAHFPNNGSVIANPVLSSSVFVDFHPRPASLRAEGVPPARLANPFRINNCKSVSKQRTLTTFRINTYKKTGGGGGIPSHFALKRFVLPISKLLYVLFLFCPLQAQASPPGSHSPSLPNPQGENAAAQSSADTDALLAEARSLLQQGKFTEADRAVRQHLEKHPDSADGHFLLGHILFREIQAQAMLGSEFERQAHGSMGGVRVLGASPEDSRAREEKAKASLTEFTAGAKYRDPDAADLKTVALDYVLLGDYTDADRWLTKMLGWTPNDSEGWYYLGRTKYNENRFAEAVAAFQRSLKLDPKNVKAQDNLGLAFAGLGRNEEAAAAYQQAIAWQAQSTAKNPGPYIDMGSLLIDENRPQDALTFLLQATEIAPRDSHAHELLGKAYTRLEELPKAQAELEKAIELSPQTPNLHCMLAPVYRKQRLAEKAKLEFDRCAALTGTHSVSETPRP